MSEQTAVHLPDAAKDTEILTRAGEDTDLDNLADHAARTPMDDLD